MLEDQTFEQFAHDLLLPLGRLADGLELQREVIGRATLMFIEQQEIGVDVQRYGDLLEYSKRAEMDVWNSLI